MPATAPRPWNWPSGRRKCTARREATLLDTLAAAYAETGQYAEAVATARAARDLAIQQANRALADAISARIKLYEHKTPFRDESLAPPGKEALDFRPASRRLTATRPPESPNRWR